MMVLSLQRLHCARRVSARDSPCCCKKYEGTQKIKYGTRFNDGDYMVAVQWYERLTESGDGERREFIRGERMLDAINSTELRLAGFPMDPFGVYPTLSENYDPEAQQN